MEQKADMSEFWKTLNAFEKVMFVLAQSSACVLPFVMLSGSWRTSICLWVAALLFLCVMGFSIKKRTGESFKISIIPRFHNFYKSKNKS